MKGIVRKNKEGQLDEQNITLRMEHTHHDAIYIRLLGFVIILIQGPCSDGEGGMDSKGEVG